VAGPAARPALPLPSVLASGDWASYGTIRLPEEAAINIKNRSYAICSAEPLPPGECSIVFDFTYDGGGPGKGGTGTLRVNGKTVGEGRVDRTVPVYFSTDDTLDVGEDWGTPLSEAYAPPFVFTGKVKVFTGKIKKVTVQGKAS